MDAVYAHIGEKYYLSGDATWADSAFIASLTDRIKKIKPNVIGNIAPNLILESNDGKWYNLYQIKASYTILVFWDPDCGHCQKAIPKLLEIYKKYEKQGVMVYAVYTQGDGPKWADYIQKNELSWINVWDPYNTSKFRDNYDIYSTPVIYVLDESKKIIAKRIEVEDIDNMLKNLLDKEDSKPGNKP
jgi:thiol-disulfide isomerase/thioredoxin